MKYAIMFLVVVGGIGRPFYPLAASSSDCIQTTCDLKLLPWPADPNLIQGALLPPTPGDPNHWQVSAGPWKHLPARVCNPDANDLAVTIEYVAGTSAVNIDYMTQERLWSFGAAVLPGPNLWTFRATNTKASRLVTVAAWGVQPEPPVVD